MSPDVGTWAKTRPQPGLEAFNGWRTLSRIPPIRFVWLGEIVKALAFLQVLLSEGGFHFRPALPFFLHVFFVPGIRAIRFADKS